jgi:hypothetical protein
VSSWSCSQLQLPTLLCEYLQELIKVDFPESGQVRPADHGIGQLLSKRSDSCRGHSLPPCRYRIETSQAQHPDCFPGRTRPISLIFCANTSMRHSLRFGGRTPIRGAISSKQKVHWRIQIECGIMATAQPTAVVLCCHAMLLIPNSPDAGPIRWRRHTALRNCPPCRKRVAERAPFPSGGFLWWKSCSG